ncbi:MAG: SRPBCC family protein [Dehalococcoidia bacterium]
MASYFISQDYDAPADFIWSVLTDFTSWPQWFPQVSAVRFANGDAPAAGAELIASGEDPSVWTRWQIVEWAAPSLLVCEHIDSNSPAAPHVHAAYLQFALADDADGCTLEVEIGAQGRGIVSDFFVGVTLGSEVRRLLPRLVDAFSDHVVRAAAGR